MSKPDELVFLRPDWQAPDRVKAVCTTRQGGYSQGPWSSFNLADHVGDNPDHVASNRKLLTDTLDLPSDPLWLKQAHGCEVQVGPYPSAGEGCDSSVAVEAGVVCAVLTADCLPVLLCSSSGGRVAAVHAGWRGLATGVIENTVQALGSDPSELIAWLGPAIGPQAFEVGQDVYDAFLSHDTEAEAAFVQHGERWLCDIYQLARQRLIALGIGQISGGGLCTYSDPDRFYSYRRDSETGRMASLIWING